MVLAGNAILAMGVAQRSPLVNYNLFALNSRMKAVAKAMETAATQYEAIRSGDGWRAHSNELRALFQRHAQLLEAVSEQSRRAMPV